MLLRGGPIATTGLAVLLPICGVLLMVWGLPRAERHKLPWRWRIGVMATGAGLIFWPPFYYFFGHADLEMVWIPIWGATLINFLFGLKRMAWADVWSGWTSMRDVNDFGWVMRPRPKPRDGWEQLQKFNEDLDSPTAAMLEDRWSGNRHTRRCRRRNRARRRSTRSGNFGKRSKSGGSKNRGENKNPD
jgi:hypothetical protein